MTIEGRIEDLIKDFVTRVTGLAREVALATLNGQLSSVHPAPSSRRAGSGALPSANASKSRTSRGKGGAKRPAGDLARLEAALVGHIESNPGQRVEQINKALRTTTKDVRLPLVKLINAGTVKTKGARRGTQYFPA